MGTASVTLLGAGKMGAAIVQRWTEAGRDVRVWNRTAAKAEALAGPHVQAEFRLTDAVNEVPVVVSILTNGAALREVFVDGGALAAMEAGSTLVDLSTIDPDSSQTIAAAAARHGVRYLRGAVSGTPAVVLAGAAGLLLSGPYDALAAAKPVLDDITSNHVFLGSAEEARVVKVAANMLLAGIMEVLAEAVVLAEASGVPRETVLEGLDSTVVSSKFLTYKGAALKSRDYRTTFRTADMRKDVRLAIDQGIAVGVPLPVMNKLRDQLDTACENGWAEEDFLSLTRVIQKAAGQPVDVNGA